MRNLSQQNKYIRHARQIHLIFFICSSWVCVSLKLYGQIYLIRMTVSISTLEYTVSIWVNSTSAIVLEIMSMAWQLKRYTKFSWTWNQASRMENMYILHLVYTWVNVMLIFWTWKLHALYIFHINLKCIFNCRAVFILPDINSTRNDNKVSTQRFHMIVFFSENRKRLLLQLVSSLNWECENCIGLFFIKTSKFLKMTTINVNKIFMTFVILWQYICCRIKIGITDIWWQI